MPITPTARRRRSAIPLEAGEIFQEIGGGRGAFGGLGNPGGELAGAGDVLRGEDGAQVRDQRFLASGRKAPGGAHLEPFDRSSVDRVNEVSKEDQLRDSRAHGNRRGARAAVMDDRATGGKDGRVIHRAHHLDVVDMRDVAVISSGGANQCPLP